MLLSTVHDLFLASRRHRGVSERTIEAYSDFNRRFIAYVGNLDIDDLDETFLESYIEYTLSLPLSQATKATYLRHLKIFLRWLFNRNYIEDELYREVHVPKTPQKIVKIYNDDEIRAIYSAVEAVPEWIKYRNYGIISLMLDSGLRLSETCNIGLNDFSFRSEILKVHGKGRKERIVPVGKVTLHYISEYLKSCPYKGDQLFYCIDGTPLTKNAVKLFVTKIQDNLQFEFSSHKLRHNFATHYCLDQYEKYGQVDIYKLMILLGHSDIQTTRRYLHIANGIIASKTNISHLDKILL